MLHLKATNCLLVFLVFFLFIGINDGNAEPKIPLLVMKVSPNPLRVPQPCPNTATVTLTLENHHLTEAKTVDWTSGFTGVRDIHCVADYTPKSGTGVVVPANTTLPITITLSFIGECEGITEISFSGIIQGTQDSDAKILKVLCGSKAPTLTTYGIITLILLLVGTGVWFLTRKHLAHRGGIA